MLSISHNANTMNIVTDNDLFLDEDKTVNRQLLNEIYHLINEYLDDPNKYPYISDTYNIQCIFTCYRMHHRNLDACINIHLENNLSVNRLEELLVSSLNVVTEPCLSTFKDYIKIILPHIEDWIKPKDCDIESYKKYINDFMVKLRNLYVEDSTNLTSLSRTSLTIESEFEALVNTIMWYDIPCEKNKNI